MKKFICVIAFVSLLSCSSPGYYSTNSYEPSSIKDGSYIVDGVTTVAEMSFQRKVIYDVYFSLESNQPDSVIKDIQELAKNCHGYIVFTRKKNIKIRVPVKETSGLVNQIETLAKVVDKYVSGQDVTEEYFDLEIKIDNIEKARKRYLELLAKAENVPAALSIEKELERLQRELDLLKGRENKLEHLIAYVTINVDVNNFVKPGPLGYIGVGLYKAVKWLFVW